MTSENQLTIGYAQQTITPSLDRKVYLAGFDRNRPAMGVHDDLYVRALALELGGTRLVLAALDLLGLPRVYCQAVEARVNEQAPGTRLILASTHTHHGPDTIGMWGRNWFRSGVDPVYMATVQHKVVETALNAVRAVSRSQVGQGLPTATPPPRSETLGEQQKTSGKRLESEAVALATTATRVPGVAKNSRDPDILDEELTCLQFRHITTQEPLATLLIFPCHPEVLWRDNVYITSDYPGYLRQAVERATGAPCLFFPGALGGMMTPDVPAHSFIEAERMGTTLADAALEALARAEVVPVETLSHAVEVYDVPLTNVLVKLARWLGLFPRGVIYKRSGVIYKRSGVIASHNRVTTEANRVDIGPIRLATGPGEVLPKLGLRIKAQLRETGAPLASFIGLANDELGYILPKEDFVYPGNPFNPGAHYEETMSVGPEAGSRLMAALEKMM